MSKVYPEGIEAGGHACPGPVWRSGRRQEAPGLDGRLGGAQGPHRCVSLISGVPTPTLHALYLPGHGPVMPTSLLVIYVFVQGISTVCLLFASHGDDAGLTHPLMGETDVTQRTV